jgi:hypothetical protein
MEGFWTLLKAGLRQPLWFGNPLVPFRKLILLLAEARPCHSESGLNLIKM